MHSYMLNSGRWWVFHYRRIMIRGGGEPYPEDKMIMVHDFETEEQAAAYTNYLNGGHGRRLGSAFEVRGHIETYSN